MKKWGFGFSAAGNIAHRMAALLSKMDQVSLVALVARQAEKGAAFQGQYGFQQHYSQLSDLLKNPGVDIVYIATPHPLHFDQAKMALEAGKHVLCEKPLVLTARQGEELQKIARANHCICMEAMWTRFLPAWHKVQALAACGAIGPVTALEGSFGGRSIHVERIAKKALAGGALMDVGVYLLHCAAMIMGEEAISIQSSAILSQEGIDEQNALILTSPKGIIASLKSSVIAPLANNFTLYGEKGNIFIPHFWNADGFTLTLNQKNGDTKEIFSFPHLLGDGFYYQIKAFIKAIEEGLPDCPTLPMAQSIRILAQCDTLRGQWAMAYPEDEGL